MELLSLSTFLRENSYRKVINGNVFRLVNCTLVFPNEFDTIVILPSDHSLYLHIIFFINTFIT